MSAPNRASSAFRQGVKRELDEASEQPTAKRSYQGTASKAAPLKATPKPKLARKHGDPSPLNFRYTKAKDEPASSASDAAEREPMSAPSSPLEREPASSSHGPDVAPREYTRLSELSPSASLHA